MKTMKFWMTAAILFCSIGSLTSCHGGNSNEQLAAITDETRPGDCEDAVAAYLIDSIASQYSPGEVSIPCIQVVELDQSHPQDSVDRKSVV